MAGNSNHVQLDNATLSFFKDENTRITISVLYMVITVINLVGNVPSMWILLFRTSPKTVSIIFMIHLTLTDLALGVALPLQIAYQLYGYHWTFGSGMCRLLFIVSPNSFMTLVFYTNMYCSILTMMAISIDRYLGIVKPMRFKQARKKKSTAVLSCILMWVLVLAVLYPLMTTDLTFEVPQYEITTCFDVLKKNMLPSTEAWAAFLFGMVVILFLFPFCITTFCYVSVIRKLTRHSRTGQKRIAVRLASVVLLVFILCFTPNNVLLLVHSVLRLFYGQSVYTAYKLSLCFSCLNSCLDPFIYYLASRDFRQKLCLTLYNRLILRIVSHVTVKGDAIRASFSVLSQFL
uniref:P2Y receptor family member 8 n=1 Tax=Tetraodon nigroviridis TaxID=99883 RepID=H3BZD0_TETNG